MKTFNKTVATLAVVGLLSILNAADGADVYKKCAACHGVNAEKKAMGKSQVIAGWEADKIVTALKGYKDGTYGGPMKGIMKGQVMRLSDADIESVAAHIATKK